MNIKKVITTGLLISVLLVSTVVVFSKEAGASEPCDSGKICNPLEFDTLSAFVEALVEVARDIGMLVAVLSIVYAGFLKVTARGDEEKLKKANKAFLWAIIGTAVLLGAWIIAQSIQGTVQEIETGKKSSLFIAPDSYVLHNTDNHA